MMQKYTSSTEKFEHSFLMAMGVGMILSYVIGCLLHACQIIGIIPGDLVINFYGKFIRRYRSNMIDPTPQYLIRTGFGLVVLLLTVIWIF